MENLHKMNKKLIIENEDLKHNLSISEQTIEGLEKELNRIQKAIDRKLENGGF